MATIDNLESQLEKHWINYLVDKSVDIVPTIDFNDIFVDRCKSSFIANPMQFILDIHNDMNKNKLDFNDLYIVYKPDGHLESFSTLAEYEHKFGKISRSRFKKWLKTELEPPTPPKPKAPRHHCCKCGAFRFESEMKREGFHPAGMKPWFMSYRYYCKSCKK